VGEEMGVTDAARKSSMDVDVEEGAKKMVEEVEARAKSVMKLKDSGGSKADGGFYGMRGRRRASLRREECCLRPSRILNFLT
jgi:hypothetical protein